MKKTLNKAHRWVTESVLLNKLNFKVALLLGSIYIFAYLLVPSIPGLSFISPFLIIAWPISTMIFINFYRLSQNKKETDFKTLLKINKENIKTDLEELELELIDFEVEEVCDDEDGIIIYAPFEQFGALQSYFEENNIEILSSGFERIPTTTVNLNEEQQADVEKLLERLEEDDDVQNVYHSMEM